MLLVLFHLTLYIYIYLKHNINAPHLGNSMIFERVISKKEHGKLSTLFYYRTFKNVFSSSSPSTSQPTPPAHSTLNSSSAVNSFIAQVRIKINILFQKTLANYKHHYCHLYLHFSDKFEFLVKNYLIADSFLRRIFEFVNFSTPIRIVIDDFPVVRMREDHPLSTIHR